MEIYFMQQQLQVQDGFVGVGYALRPYKGARGRKTIRAKEPCTGQSGEVVGSMSAERKRMTERRHMSHGDGPVRLGYRGGGSRSKLGGADDARNGRRPVVGGEWKEETDVEEKQ
jgi:hypothetical protein